jgi:hypothetical protein
MKITMIALGAGAGCLLLAGSAMAGPCSAQIDVVAKQLNATDAGMGPTGGATASGDTMAQAGGGTTASPSGDGQTTHPPTGTMNEASQNKATSAQDVQSQNTGQGTAADQATGMAGHAEASASLERARQFDQAGDQVACTDEVNKAQKLLTQ